MRHGDGRRSERRGKQVKLRLSDEKAEQLDRFFAERGTTRQAGLEALIDDLLTRDDASKELPMTGT